MINGSKKERIREGRRMTREQEMRTPLDRRRGGGGRYIKTTRRKEKKRRKGKEERTLEGKEAKDKRSHYKGREG